MVFLWLCVSSSVNEVPVPLCTSLCVFAASLFFVASDPTVKTDRLWHDKYTLRTSMIPSFMTMDQSRKVLLIGKSINFLHQVCHDQTPPTKMIAVPRSAEPLQDVRPGVGFVVEGL
ncbi:hypothetical protein E5288_WYG007462 [Bos mutus]|uniref:Gamma tubulin complex component protein N-terminal domain-containing protein n=1 Tax=Bos mutus TaxID=72004 RepID=A0A6B0SH95_9CETA|nr:hypothetical protein [Bos mutus]